MKLYGKYELSKLKVEASSYIVKLKIKGNTFNRTHCPDFKIAQYFWGKHSGSEIPIGKSFQWVPIGEEQKKVSASQSMISNRQGCH